jgi:cytochrome c-type biogenesis protein CcmH/NrfF
MIYPENIITFCKPIAGITTAGIAYIVDTATPKIPGVPEWVTSLGLPIAFLVAVIYALATTNRALRQSEKDRHEDAKAYSAALLANLERSNESRERLIRATDQQTAKFEELASQLRNRPCQNPDRH